VYLTTALSIGLPNDFEAPSPEKTSARSSRSSQADPGKNIHIELTLMSNLKVFFQNRDIDVQNILQNVKSSKRA